MDEEKEELRADATKPLAHHHLWLAPTTAITRAGEGAGRSQVSSVKDPDPKKIIPDPK
jgi:hypothetical protein